MNEQLLHPYSPDVDWTLAVSRRFRGEHAVGLYTRAIAPALAEHGTVLECSYASDDYTASDYWIDRITTILAVSDIHILLDLDRSGYVEFEFERSRMQTLKGGAPALAAAYGWAPGSVGLLRPSRVLITDGRQPRPAGRAPRTTVLRIDRDMSDSAIAAAVHEHVLTAKRTRITWARRSGKSHGLAARVFSFWPERAKLYPEPRLVCSDAYRVACALRDGATFATLGPAVAATQTSAVPVNDDLQGRSTSITREIQDWYVRVKSGDIELPPTFSGRYVHIRERYREWARRGLGESALSSRSLKFGIAVIAFLGAMSRKLRPTRR